MCELDREPYYINDTTCFFKEEDGRFSYGTLVKEIPLECRQCFNPDCDDCAFEEQVG
jgi:hypothetical protein